MPGIKIVGLDNMNDYYDISIMDFCLAEIKKLAAAHADCARKFVHGNLAYLQLIDSLFAQHHFSVVVSLAAQAGVRYSITSPDVYRLLQHFRVLLRHDEHRLLRRAFNTSSSSVHGSNKKFPAVQTTR